MTYEEYKSSKKKDYKKKKGFFKNLFNKLLIVIIFVLIVLIACNYSPKFKTFIEEKVLSNTIDFSKINKLLGGVTDIFDEEEDATPVIATKEENEKYLDGVKIKTIEGSEVKIKNSGIVTFIGDKEGYGNTIIVQQSNGYYAWYGNIKEKVKLYDYVNKDMTLGTALDAEYYYVLLKDDKPIEITNEN